ncbi:hypothetical protein [Mucilaginibacter sp. L196]|uniref:hypothetical protein n=1 Tax=Mucilaginibacter sp. L196 TaxID=1641870 RepID=UPI00131B23CE|nr:hypothetical protein [Mucilaginibacter sp. L196]
MKKSPNLFASLLICLALTSCLKGSTKNTDNIQISTANLVSNWSLVNDTTTTNFWGLWSGRPAIGINYIGKTGDHYNFTSYGKLYIQQDNSLDTQTYKLSHDTVMVEYVYIDGPTMQVDSGYNARYIITSLTSHTCTLTSSVVSPETVFNSTIKLSR